MYKNLMLTIIAVCMVMITYYARQSCQIPYEVVDQDIRTTVQPDKLELTLDYAAKLFNVIPVSYINGEYLPAQNQGFIARIINEMRRDYPRYYAYKEVVDPALAQFRYQYICWVQAQAERTRANAEIDELSDNKAAL